MATVKLETWAKSLVDKPISLSDDWGNMILSTGLAFQQRPQDRQGLGSELDHISTTDMIATSQSSSGPQQARKLTDKRDTLGDGHAYHQ